MKVLITIGCFLIIGFNTLLGQNQQDLMVAFSEIDSLQYIEYKKKYSNNLVINPTKKTILGSSFSLIVKNAEQSFGCQEDGYECYYYRGFLQELNSFVITRCGMLTCSTFLMDQASGETQNLFSPYDSECKAPLLSKNQTKLFVYASSVFEKESFISIYQRIDKKEKFDFKSYKSLISNEWKIYEAIWINDTSFALMAFDKYGGKSGDEPLHLKYIKGKIR